MLLLEFIVMHINFWSKLNFLDLDNPLVLFGLTSSLLFLVLVLAKIHYFTDRGHRRWRNFYKIETLLSRDGQCLWGRHDAKLFAGVIDNADFSDPNALVGAHTIITSGRAVVSYIVLR